jgi:hypothetical protein
MMTWVVVLMLSGWQHAQAVFRNPNGVGEVLLLPHYSVNNDLNTLVEVVNTTDQGKAIKINIKERWFGEAVISYNVYLGPHDSWSFALLPDNSEVSGLFGDQGMKHLTIDDSCTPGLERPGFIASPDLIREPYFLPRVRDGFIEILEMGVLTGAALQAVGTNQAQGASDCALINDNWSPGGNWTENSSHELLPASGGLSADVSLINVSEGINYGFPAVALSDFYPEDVIHHTAWDGAAVSLDLGSDVAWLPHETGFRQLRFDQGIDAVNATLMSHEFEVSFYLDDPVNGLTEIILNLPTKEHMRISSSSPGAGYLPPFNMAYDASQNPDDRCGLYQAYSGFAFGAWVFNDDFAGFTTPFQDTDFPFQNRYHSQSCYAGLSYVPRHSVPWDNAALLSGASHFDNLMSPFDDSGFARFFTVGSIPLTGTEVATGDLWQVNGIPLLGVVLQRYTNGGAGPGLLAQYGGARLIKSRSLIERIP